MLQCISSKSILVLIHPSQQNNESKLLKQLNMLLMEEILHQLRLVGYLPLLTTGFIHPNGGWPGGDFFHQSNSFLPSKPAKFWGFFIGGLTCSPQTQAFFSQWQAITFQLDGAKKSWPSWPLEAEGNKDGVETPLDGAEIPKQNHRWDVTIIKRCKMMANINHV